jgi:hypothetical protein
MKLFFKNIVYFSAFLLLLCFINWSIEKLIYRKVNLVLNNKYTTVIAGNSRLQMINPLWIKNSVNISKGGQSYFFTYRCLAKLIQDNPHIRQVILSTSFDNFLYDYSHVRDNDKEYYTPHQLLHYIKVLSFEDIKNSHYLGFDYAEVWLKKIYVPVDFENTLKIMFKYKFGYQGINHLPYYGNFHTSYKSNLSNDRVESFVRKINSFKISNWNEKSFYSIVRLCKEKKIKLILVTTPFPKQVRSRIKSIFYKNFERITKNAQKYNSTITYLNFFNETFPLNNYGDPHHLNSIGSKKLAEKISSLISN